MKTKVKRVSNIELLRIIAMIMIIMHHFALHGCSQLQKDYTFNTVVIDVFILGGKVGVDLFVLISGYFMVDSKITMRKILKFVGQVWFYSSSIFLLFRLIITPDVGLSYLDGVHFLFPILYGENWFASTYFWLMLSVPLLNYVINKLDDKQIVRLIITILFVCSVLPVFLEISIILSNYGWFVVLYVLAAYIKRRTPLEGKCIKNFLFAGMLYGCLFVLNIYYYRYREQYSIVVVLISLELFLGFLKMKSFYNKWINLMASAAFGVYLIHDNALVRPYLWNDIFHVQRLYEQKGFVLSSLKIVILIFAFCVMIDLLRQKTVEKIWMKVIDRCILPNIPIIKRYIEIFIKKSCDTAKRFYNGKLLREEKKRFLMAFLIIIIIALSGGGSLYLNTMNNINNRIELLYVFIRYTINLLYLVVPLYFVLCHIINFLKYVFLNYKINKAIGTIFIRIVTASVICTVILLVRGYGYCTLIQNYMQDKRSEYFFWILILIGLIISFTNKKYLNFYKMKHE